MSIVVAREGGLVALPKSIDRHEVIDKLLHYSAAAPFPCFRLKHGSLYAAEVVGTLQLGKLRLSILPKSDLGDEERDREFLLNMLRAAGYLGPRAVTNAASVRASSLDPLEAMLTEVAREMLANVQDGAPRRYEEFSLNSITIRGRIDFGRLSRQLPGAAATIPIRYSPLSASNVLSRTLRWVAESLAQMARSEEARQVVAEVSSHFGQVSGPRITRSEVLGLRLSRYEMRWARTMEIAKLLVNGQFIDPTFAGRADAFGMLFPLQHLFERALRRLLAEAGKESGLLVTHRSEALYMLRSATNASFLRLKPDFVFSKDGRTVLLGDAKWKRLNVAARAFGAERGDIYQMNAYLTGYCAQKAALFVPRMGWMKPGWHETFFIPPANQQLSLYSVDIEKLVSHVHTTRQQASLLLSDSLAAAAGIALGGGHPTAGGLFADTGTNLA